MVKVGIGQDSHKFVDDKPLILGGIHIPDTPGLHANSDGDAVIHALCNALGTALGRGALSTYADDMCKNQNITDSKEYLKVALGFTEEEGYDISNISIAIEAGRPKLEQHFPAMKKKLSELLSIKENEVGIAVTSGEKIAPFGRGVGIQVFASVCLEKS
jgi:2-C-methyl-D-erythritol 2,4-cyclodiphosphate synthase